jgi:hypothetical protein
VRHVDDLHDAVDQRQADRRDEQPARINQAVCRDGENLVYFLNPALIQSALFTPSGGFTCSAG